MIGKPYSGKPNVRFDEGELEIELLATTPALYSTVIYRTKSWELLSSPYLKRHIVLKISPSPSFSKRGNS